MTIDNDKNLNRNERDSIFYLVFLYMRIGKLKQAERILKNLQTACPEEERTDKYLAAIALEQEDGKKALDHLAAVLDRSKIKTQDAPLLLMQAKAQWMLGKEEESHTTLNEYLTMAGDCK